MLGEVNNNSFDCSSLGFVDGHAKGKIKGKWLFCMNFGNGREGVLVQKVKCLLELSPVDFAIVVARRMAMALFLGSMVQLLLVTQSLSSCCFLCFDMGFPSDAS